MATVTRATQMLVLDTSKLVKVISGGQTGADQAGLYEAAINNLQTGGWAPTGWKTHFGPVQALKEFGLIEGGSYAARTKKNVRDSDGTIRFASSFTTPGEICTLKAINSYKKPHLDVDLLKEDPAKAAERVVSFIIEKEIGALNVAGNTDKDTRFGFHFHATSRILQLAFAILKSKELIYVKPTNL